MDIASLRRLKPELADLSDQEVVRYVAADYPNIPVDKIASELGVAVAAAPAEGRTLGGTIKDMGISALQGVIGVPEAAVGLADMATGGQVGKALEGIGYRPEEAQSILQDQYSDPQKQAFKAVQDANGVVDTTVAALKNPSTIVQGVVQSLPGMAAGGLVGRGILAVGARAMSAEAAAAGSMGPYGVPGALSRAVASSGTAGGIAGALGEGVTMAGQDAEQIRTNNADRLLTGEQSRLAVGIGAEGALFSMLGAKVAKAMGIHDVDTMIAAGHASDSARKGIVRRVLEGAFSEGILEELPQSVGEQVLQNIAMDRPIDQDVDHQAVMGALSGMAMGAGGNAMGGYSKKQPHPDKDAKPGAQPGTQPAPANVDPAAGPLSLAATTGIAAGAAAPAQDAATLREAVDKASAVAAQTEPDPRAQQDAEIARQQRIAEANREAAQAAADEKHDRDAAVYEDVMGARPAPAPLSDYDDSEQARAREPAPGAAPAVTPGTVDEGAHESHSSPLNDKSATPEQILGDSAELGHTKFRGRDVSVENADGSERVDLKNTPPQWRTKMQGVHYGRVLGTTAADGDHLDIYLRAGTPKDYDGPIYVVDQVRQDGSGKFDEAKVMAGFKNRAAAIGAYRQHYTPGWHMGRVTEMTAAQYDQWLATGDLTKPAHAKGEMTPGELKTTSGGKVHAASTQQEAAAPTPAVGAAQQPGADAAAAPAAAPVEAAGRYALNPKGDEHGENFLRFADEQGNQYQFNRMAGEGGYATVTDKDGNRFKVSSQSDSRANSLQAGNPPEWIPQWMRPHLAALAQAQTRDEVGAVAQAVANHLDGKETTNENASAAPAAQPAGGQPASHDVANAAPGGDVRAGVAPEDAPAGEPGAAPRGEAAAGDAKPAAQQPVPEPVAPKTPRSEAKDRWTRMTATERQALLERHTAAKKPEKIAQQPWDQLAPNWHSAIERALKAQETNEPAPGAASTEKVHRSMSDAEDALRAAGKDTHEIVRVPKGLAVRPKAQPASNAAAEPARDKNGNVIQHPKLGGDDRWEYPPKVANEPAELTEAKRRVVDYMNGDIDRPTLMRALEDSGLPQGTLFGITQRLQNDGPSMGEMDAMLARREAKTAAPAPIATRAPKPQVSANTVFTDDAAEKARAVLRAKLGQLNSGFDPELMQAGLTLAGWHIEKGARTFAAFAKSMLGDMGDIVRPYLKSWYMAMRYDPRAAEFSKEMSSPSLVDEFDVADVEAPTYTPNAETSDTAAETDEPKETLPGASNDTGRNAATDDQSLEDALPGSRESDGQGGNAETGDGVREADAQGDGQPEESGPGRADGVDGSAQSVLPDLPAEVRPLADGPLGHTEDRPQPLAGENPGNFAIGDDFALGAGTEGEKIDANMAALRTLRQVQKEHRYPTRAEQATMARYVGWGGLKSVFDPKHEGASNKFGRAQTELKALLSDEEYRAANGSIRNAHYTAAGVVDAMWRVARFMGFNGGRALEPTVGIGNFIGRQPADMAASTDWHASELDAVTGQMAALIYPEANILAATGFQSAPFADGAFDLSIGNPPFGAQPIEDKSAQRKHLSGMKIHNYIIAKAGMHLRPGGVMSMVVTHRFLDTANPEARAVLAKDFRLLGAFRLPNDAFAANAGTEVTTDVVFLQKLRADEARERDASWLDVNGTITVDGQDIRVNRYFQDNPTHILGRSAMDGTMYAGRKKDGEGEYTVHSDGRDLGHAIDALMGAGFSHMQGVLEKKASDLASTPAMLAQSDLPVGGVMLEQDGRIMRRELDDASGNAVVAEITPETLWKDQAADWQALRTAIEDVKKQSAAGKLTAEDAGEVLNLAQFLHRSDGTRPEKATIAAKAVFDLLDALATPAAFQWAPHQGALDAVAQTLARKQLGEDGYRSLKGMLDLRNRTIALVRAEQTEAKNMEALRADLNRAYDAFVKANGFLSDPANANLLDGDVGAEAGLEAEFTPAISTAVAKSSGVPTRKAAASKADILRQRVNFPHKEIDRADSAPDALFASLSEHGKVDLPYMAKISGRSVREVIADLTAGENPQLFRDPESGEYQEAERYLSGNVKHKLKIARERGLTANIKALEAAQPAPKTRAQVKPNIRGMWMPSSIFQEFLQSLGYREATITAIQSQGMLSAQAEGLNLTDFGIQFRHGRKTPVEMFNAAAAGKPITIYDRDASGNQVKNDQATKEVNALVERMGKVFQEWAYSDTNRADRIVESFNENMNTHAARTYDGTKYLKPVGASPSISLRRTQKDAAWRMMQEPTILLDHVVGAGKTYTIITGIMERRRMGLSRKPMVAVPNHLVTQWARDFYKLYPGAKVLAASPADFAKNKRRRLLARIATGDYDAVIVGHTSIGFMQTPTEDIQGIVNEKLAGLKEALDAARVAKESKRTLGQIQDRIDRYEAKLAELQERTTDDIGIDFKALGVDYLAVDEAHEFKNLEYSTSGERVVGMNDPNGSKKAFDLYGKVRGLFDRKGGVAFATGTPVSNSLVEIYTVMSYLAHDELKLRGQEHFDAWSGAYAATETRLEYTATQKLKPRRVLAGLNNLSALRQLYEQFADIITMSDLKRLYTEEKELENVKRKAAGQPAVRTDFPVPKVKDGKRQLVAGDITPTQREYMDYLVARMAAIEAHKGDKEYARIDNALNVLTDARKMSLDVRIVDPTAPRDENGKVATAARNIKTIYDQWSADRGTQLVFCDLSTPAKTAAKDARRIISETIDKLYSAKHEKVSAKRRLESLSFEKQWQALTERADELAASDSLSEERRDDIAQYMAGVEDPEATMNVADIGFSVYDDMRALLVEKGIPESEIAFIHDFNSPDQKEKLFDRVNNGYVRVLLGSSAKMGAGTNAQRRLVALHHMDAPWRPSDVEQREGRIIRQGNMLYERDPDGFEVDIRAYSTNNTSDTVMWQVLQRKAAAIEQFREGGIDSVEEEGGDSDQYAEFMATSTGNPVFRQKLEAERKVTELEADIGGALITRSNAKGFLDTYPRRLAHYEGVQSAFKDFAPASASYGGQEGTAAELKSALDAANAEYMTRYAEWTEKKAAAEVAIKKWELEPESTRGKKPAFPVMPSQPTLLTPSVQKASGYARAMASALAEAKVGKTARITMGDGSLELEGIDRTDGEKLWILKARRDGVSMPLAQSTAASAAASSRLVEALTPAAITADTHAEAQSAASTIQSLKRRKAEADKAASLEVDTSKRDAAREELEWFKAQVAFAETRADIDRGERKNRFIARDRKRNLSQTAAVTLDAPQEIEVAGEKYTTTGLKGRAGFNTVLEATRADGTPAVLVEKLAYANGKSETSYAAIDQPKSLRSQPGNIAQTGEPVANTADVLFRQDSRAASLPADAKRVSQLQAKADAMTDNWTRKPEVTVVASVASPAVPKPVRDEARKRIAEGGAIPSGVIYDGHVWIFADRIASEDKLAEVIAHEIKGHYGLRGNFGAELDAILRQLASARPSDVAAMMRKNGMKPEQRLQAAEEVLTEMAQKEPQLGFVRRAIVAVRNFLRKIGVKLELSDADIIGNWLTPAARFVETGQRSGKAAPGAGSGAQFAQPRGFNSREVQFAGQWHPIDNAEGQNIAADHDMSKLRNFWSWFGDSKIVDDKGRPRVVYRAMAGTALRAHPDTGMIHVALDRREAEKFAVGEGRQVQAVYVRAKNPFDYRNTADLAWIKSKLLTPGGIARYNADTKAAMGQGYEHVAERGDIEAALEEGAYQAYELPYVSGLIRDRGHDAIYVHEDGAQSREPNIAVFDAGAIKSVDNAGTFDARSSDIAFSQSVDPAYEGTNNLRQFLGAGHAAVNEFMHTPGKLNWWHKTFGTPYNLAERSAPFKRVYDRVQTFLEDVSHYATEAADLAPKILPKLDSWRDLLPKAMGGKEPLAVADKKAIQAPIWEGTLMYTRDQDGRPIAMSDVEARYADMDAHEKGKMLMSRGIITEADLKRWQNLPIQSFEGAVNNRFDSAFLTAGIRWTDKELRDRYGLNDHTLELYRQSREAMDSSLTRLALSDMAKFAGKDARDITDAVMEAKTVHEGAETLRDYLLSLADTDADRADALRDTANRIIDKADKAQQLMDRGYAPLMRFGHYTVDVVDGETGNREYFGLYESRMDARKAAEQLARQFPGATVRRGTVSDEAYKQFAGVSVETLELFGEMMGLEAEGSGATHEAFQQYLKLTKSNRSALRRMIQRQGIAGFNEDISRVLAGFIYSNARQTSANLHAGEIGEAVQDVAQRDGELKDAAYRLMHYVQNPQEEAPGLRGLMFAQYLGGSVAAMLVNMTQPFQITMPYLSQYGGIRKAASAMAGAVKVAWAESTGNGELDAALKRAEEDGVVAPQEVHQLQAYMRGRDVLRAGDGTLTGNAAATASNAASRVLGGWGKLFSTAELFNRRVTYVAAWNNARERGLGAVQADAFARKAIADTQFTYNKGNRPEWARGAVGSTLFTFKQYSISYMELMHRMWTQGGPEGKKAALFALGMIVLMAGAGGLPFADDAADIIEGVGARFGYNFSVKAKRREALNSLFGQVLGDFLEKGISSVAPLDVSGRLGMANLIPGTGLLQKKADHTSDVAELAGPVGDFAKRVFKAGGDVLAGKPVDAALDVAPVAIRNLSKGADMATHGMYRDESGKKVLDTDGYDAFTKAVGFQPADVARVQEANFIVQQRVAAARLAQQEIADEWAKRAFDKDPAAAQWAREQVTSWNAKNPDAPIRISYQDVTKRLRKMNESKAQRIAEAAPKAMRAEVLRELAGGGR